MNGFVEQKVETLRGMSKSSTFILWVCAVVFLAPGLNLGRTLLIDWITQPQALDSSAFISVGVILGIGLLITFFAIKRSRQRAQLTRNPYAFVIVFGSEEDPRAVSQNFNVACQQKLDFEYANYMYVTSAHILAYRKLWI